MVQGFSSNWHRLCALLSLAARLSSRDEDPRQAAEGSLRALTVVLAMKHCKGFAERVCIAKPKHFKGFLLIFVGAGGYKDVKELLPNFIMIPKWESAKENVTSLIIY